MDTSEITKLLAYGVYDLVTYLLNYNCEKHNCKDFNEEDIVKITQDILYVNAGCQPKLTSYNKRLERLETNKLELYEFQEVERKAKLKTELMCKKCDELKVMLRSKGLLISGNKLQMVERLLVSKRDQILNPNQHKSKRKNEVLYNLNFNKLSTFVRRVSNISKPITVERLDSENFIDRNTFFVFNDKTEVIGRYNPRIGTINYLYKEDIHVCIDSNVRYLLPILSQHKPTKVPIVCIKCEDFMICRGCGNECYTYTEEPTYCEEDDYYELDDTLRKRRRMCMMCNSLSNDPIYKSCC